MLKTLFANPKDASNMMENFKSDALTSHAVEGLIARSGIISRQILKFYRFMRASGPGKNPAPEASVTQRVHYKLRRSLSAVKINVLADLLYTYYLGGSLTRQDQITFAKIHGMQSRAYFLTAFNALFCGIPTAAVYFLVGEGFQILSRVHSVTELPALLAGNVSLGLGAVSLAVDLFRAVDAFVNKRCWAPFGLLPAVINFPTYLKIGIKKIKAGRSAKPVKAKTQAGPRLKGVAAGTGLSRAGRSL